MLYGEPRVTHDIDLVAFLRVEDAAKLAALFPAPAFYYPDSRIGDKNWRGILAVGQAGARKDARSGLCPSEQRR